MDIIQKTVSFVAIIFVLLSATSLRADDVENLTGEAEPFKKTNQRKETFQAEQRDYRQNRSQLKSAKDQIKWEQVQNNTRSLLRVVHYDQFVSRILTMQENIFLPQATLQVNEASIKDWDKKRANHFAYEAGEGTILHFETFYYGEAQGVVYPSYALQLNLEIPANRFRDREKILVKDLKGYLAWVHPDFPDGDLVLWPNSGQVELWRIKNNTLMGQLNIKFSHPSLKDPIHIYGKIRSTRLTTAEYAAKQNNVLKEMQTEVAALDELPIHRDRLKARYDFKSREKKDVWVEGRSSDLWRAEKK